MKKLLVVILLIVLINCRVNIIDHPKKAPKIQQKAIPESKREIKKKLTNKIIKINKK